MHTTLTDCNINCLAFNFCSSLHCIHLKLLILCKNCFPFHADFYAEFSCLFFRFFYMHLYISLGFLFIYNERTICTDMHRYVHDIFFLIFFFSFFFFCRTICCDTEILGHCEIVNVVVKWMYANVFVFGVLVADITV